MSSIEGIRQRLESLFAGVADAIPTTGPLDRSALLRETSRPRGWVWELDLEGKYTWCSPEIERILGFTQDEAQGNHFRSIGFDDEQANIIQEHLQSGEPIQQLRLEATHKQGQSIPILIRAMQRVDASGNSLGYRGVTQLVEGDIPTPERMVVEVPLPAEEVDAFTPPTYAPTWGELLGFEDDGAEIQPLDKLVDPHQVLSEESRNRLVIPLQVQDEIIGVIELEDQEEAEGWTEDERALANAIAHELAITLQDARSYQLTQQALEEMREADRLKSQFLANMSHELRTPLNSIIGFSRVILKGIDGPITETQEQDLNAIYNAGQHLLGLINNILDISKIEAGKMELAFTDVDLSEIIRGVMATAVGLVKDKPIELITDIPEQLPFVQGDNIRIRQVLLNLVSNAAKFTEQGHIGVSARTIRRGNTSEVVIAVFDTGPGIDQDDQERIFEPFSQVDASPTRKTGGTGLGLSISRHLVELHGGVIWVESIPDEGSTFAFTLPFDPELQFTRTSTPMIMGIDHDPPALLQYRESLEGQGYRFHALSRPDQAPEVLQTLQPQAVVIDLMEDHPALWEILFDMVDEILQNPIPILITQLSEPEDSGTFLPIHYWLPSAVSDEVLCTALGSLTDSGERPTLLVVEADATQWSRLLAAVESQDCAHLELLESLDQLKSRISANNFDGILFDLSFIDDHLLSVIEYLAELEYGQPIPSLGLLPESLTKADLSSLNELTQALKDIACKERGEHLAKLMAFLQERVPQER